MWRIQCLPESQPQNGYWMHTIFVNFFFDKVKNNRTYGDEARFSQLIVEYECKKYSAINIMWSKGYIYIYIYIYIYSKSVKASECNSSWYAESEV